MWKKVVGALILLGFAWSVPQVRARIIRALDPAAELLGPVGYRLQEPMRRYRAETDIKFLVDQLQMDRNEGKAIPTNTRGFNDWMSERRGAGDGGRDPWGQYYWMVRDAGVVRVGSNGPDGERGTEDDLTRRADL